MAARPTRRWWALLDAARSIELPHGRIFHWIAAETAVATSVRRCLTDRAVAPAAIESRGYWKLAARDHQEPHAD